MTNLEIAELLRAIAAAYELKDAEKNRFRIIAYERAADAVEHASSELKDIYEEGSLDKDVPGIGKSIADHLEEIFKTGRSKHFDEVLEGIPKPVFELTKVSGIGVKTASKLVKQLGIKSSGKALDELAKAAREGKIRGLPGFGEGSETAILRSISEVKGREKRHLLPYADSIAQGVVAWMKKHKGVKKIEPMGSLRRRASTIGDIDVGVAADNPADAVEHFTKYPKASRILEKGEKSASIILPGNVQVDIKAVKPNAFGSLLQHFTGSKHHNVALREYALKRKMSLSEHGIKIKGKLKSISTEEEFYKQLGMKWIPPELREERGEIKAALDGKLPDLVEIEDIRGDLQIHSNFDVETSHDVGQSTMKDCVKKADELGYEYIAFTEHNPSHTRHRDCEIIAILASKKDEIEQLNSELSQLNLKRVIKVFNSLEIDILPDGKLPVPEEGMKTLDFALVSIHSSFRLSRSEMTKRVLSGLDHPKVKIFAHPTARKLNEREGIELNWPEIFDFCLKNNKWIEINADPMRLDLPDFLVKDAVEKGVKLTLGTDSHHVDSMVNMKWGVSVARRGWATPENIVNTRSLQEVEKMLQ